MTTPWLTIVGLGEDGPDGLPPASAKALNDAEIVIGAARHLSLLQDVSAETIAWPVPFADGIPMLLGMRGRNVVMLASGDPFWYGAGASVTRHLEPGEWRALPAPSTFSLAAAHLGWPLEHTQTFGLHAAPFSRLFRHLHRGAHLICTIRDGEAVGDLARWLTQTGFGTTTMFVLQAMGGPRQHTRQTTAHSYDLTDVQHPVIVGLDVGVGPALTHASGLPDHLFDNDGQITKQPVRALTLSALAPLADELLWDIGLGSGSISIEWLLAHPTTRAIGIEANPDRAARARENADRFGVDLTVVEAEAPDGLADLPAPDAVFIGGGVSDALLTALWDLLPKGTRVVVNGVTLEAEALMTHWQAKRGGTQLRIELSGVGAIGRKRGWRAAYPVVQWSVVT